MNNMKQALLLSCLALLVAGCGTTAKNTETNHYYVLENSSGITTQTATKTKQVVLKPLIVPAYLKQTRLVMKGAGSDIRYANYHHWAETPKRAIYVSLLDKLNATSTDLYVQHCRNCEQVGITIRKFYPTTAGEVVLTGFMTRIDATGTVLVQQPFALTEPLAQGGYNESVQKMDRLLSRLVSAIEQAQ